MNKRKLHHYWTYFRTVKPRYFLIAALLSAAVCIYGLRANNQQMANLRSQVYSADKDGGDVQTAVQALQAYVTRHMNTSLSTGNTTVYPPIQLQYTYQRLVQKQSETVQATNGALYTQAQNYCQAQNPNDFSGRNRIPCIESYVKDHGVAVPKVSPSLYQFDFIAPKWSPDVAGWALFATIILVFLTVGKFVADRRLKKYLK